MSNQVSIKSFAPTTPMEYCVVETPTKYYKTPSKKVRDEDDFDSEFPIYNTRNVSNLK
jgi:hypothetical protein